MLTIQAAREGERHVRGDNENDESDGVAGKSALLHRRDEANVKLRDSSKRKPEEAGILGREDEDQQRQPEDEEEEQKPEEDEEDNAPLVGFCRSPMTPPVSMVPPRPLRSPVRGEEGALEDAVQFVSDEGEEVDEDNDEAGPVTPPIPTHEAAQESEQHVRRGKESEAGDKASDKGDGGQPTDERNGKPNEDQSSRTSASQVDIGPACGHV